MRAHARAHGKQNMRGMYKNPYFMYKVVYNHWYDWVSFCTWQILTVYKWEFQNILKTSHQTCPKRFHDIVKKYTCTGRYVQMYKMKNIHFGKSSHVNRCSKGVTVYKNCIKNEYSYCKISQNGVQSCTFLYKAEITSVNGQNLSLTPLHVLTIIF